MLIEREGKLRVEQPEKNRKEPGVELLNEEERELKFTVLNGRGYAVDAEFYTPKDGHAWVPPSPDAKPTFEECRDKIVDWTPSVRELSQEAILKAVLFGGTTKKLWRADRSYTANTARVPIPCFARNLGTKAG